MKRVMITVDEGAWKRVRFAAVEAGVSTGDLLMGLFSKSSIVFKQEKPGSLPHEGHPGDFMLCPEEDVEPEPTYTQVGEVEVPIRPYSKKAQVGKK